MNGHTQRWGELFVHLAPMIVGLGILGIVIILGLLIAWRRHQQRQRQLDEDQDIRHTPEPHIDAWGSAAGRLETAPPSKKPRTDPTAPPWEDNGDEPWRESLDDPDFDGDVDDDDSPSDDEDEPWR